MSVLIDVWDTETFDQELISKLRANEQLVRDYLTTDRRQYEEREASDHRMPHASNPYARDYLAFLEAVGRDIMQSRTIRAWHYTRLVDDEVDIIVKTGIYPSTLQTFRPSLAPRVKSKAFSSFDPSPLYPPLPFHNPP